MSGKRLNVTGDHILIMINVLKVFSILLIGVGVYAIWSILP